MEYAQELSLELNSNTAYTTIGAKQGDNLSRTISIRLLQNGEEYQIPSGSTAYFRFRKPDGKAIVNTATIENNKIRVLLTAQTLSTAGRGYADVTLQNGTEILSSVSFIIIIMAAPQVVSEIVSSNEFTYLNDVISSANLTINEAEAWARGTRGGAEVFPYDTFTPSYYSPQYIITGVEVDQNIFFNKVGHEPGLKRSFTFTYTEQGTWLVTANTTSGAVTIEDAPENTNNIGSYGIVVTTLQQGLPPNAGDYVKVVVEEADLTYQNNSKYYSEVAAHEVELAQDQVAAAASQVQLAADQVALASAEAQKIVDMTVSAQTLETGYPAYASKTEIGGVAHIEFGLPKGNTGDVYYATFGIDPMDGILRMYYAREMTNDITFTLNQPHPLYTDIDHNGCLMLAITRGGE